MSNVTALLHIGRFIELADTTTNFTNTKSPGTQDYIASRFCQYRILAHFI